MLSRAPQLPLEPSAGCILQLIERHSTPRNNRGNQDFGNDAVYDLSAPGADTLQFAQQIQFSATRVGRYRVSRDPFVVPLPLTTSKCLAIRNRPDQARPPAPPRLRRKLVSLLREAST